MKQFVYIVECADTTLYVGCTNNIAKRIKEHNTSKRGAHYTKIRRPVELRYVEELDSLAEARAREAQLKRLSRKQKIALISELILSSGMRSILRLYCHT